MVMIKAPIKLMVVSPFSVHNQVDHAGGQTLNYYLKKFSDDPAFEVGYVVPYTCSDQSYGAMKEQYKEKGKDFSQEVPYLNRVLRFLYWRSICYPLSLLNAKRIMLDPMTESAIMKGLEQARQVGWIPDIVILEWTQMIFLNDRVKKLFPHARIIGTAHDVSFQGLERKGRCTSVYTRLERMYWRRIAYLEKKYEVRQLKSMDLAIVFDIKDKDLIVAEHVDEDKIGVITPFYHQFVPEIRPNKRIGKIIFFGAMHRLENQTAVDWFITKVFKPLRENILKLEFVVIGGGLPAKFAQRYNDSGVAFTGFVNDPGACFSNAICMVAPMFLGAGIKIKVLEGMAAGLPVLTGKVGIEGIGAEPGKQYVHCETPDEYRYAILALLAEPMESQNIGKNAQRFVTSQYDLLGSYTCYREKILELLNRRACSL